MFAPRFSPQVQTVRKRLLVAGALFLTVALSACGGGGGSTAPAGNDTASNGDEEQLEDDQTGNGSNDGSAGDDTGTATGSAGTDTAGTNTGTSTGGTDTSTGAGGTDTGTGTTTGSAGSDSAGDDGQGSGGGGTDGNGATGRLGRLIITEPAINADLEDEDLYRMSTGTLRVNKAGDVAFVGSGPAYQAGARLYAGSVFGSVTPVIEPGDAVDGLAASVRIETVSSVVMGPGGRALAFADVAGSAEFTTLVENRDGNVHAVISAGDALDIPGESSATVNRFKDIDVDGNHIALQVFAESGPSALYLDSGEGFEYLLPSSDRYLEAAEEIRLMPLFEDGCRARFVDDSLFALTSSGALFLVVEMRPEDSSRPNEGICPGRFVVVDETESSNDRRLVGNNYRAVLAYTKDDGFTQVMSSGTSVPGISDAVFTSMSLLSVAPSGIGVVSALIAKPSTGEEFQSWWSVELGQEPRLLAIEGERFEQVRGDESLELGTTLNYGSRVLVANDGTVSFLYKEWLLSGMAHPDPIPYATLPVSGGGSLKAIASLNGPAFDGFSDTAYVSALGHMRPWLDGRMLFSASVTDVDDASLSKSGIWLADANQTVVRVAGPGDVVETDGVPVRLGNSAYTGTNLHAWPIDGGWLLVADMSEQNRERLVLIPVDALQ